jgi:hypothetical protein
MPIFLNFQKIEKAFLAFFGVKNDVTCIHTKSLNFDPHNHQIPNLIKFLCNMGPEVA